MGGCHVNGDNCRIRVFNWAIGVDRDCSRAAALPVDLSRRNYKNLQLTNLFAGSGTPNALSAPSDPLSVLSSMLFIFVREASTGIPVANKVTIPSLPEPCRMSIP